MCATLANFMWLIETLAQFLNPGRKVFYPRGHPLQLHELRKNVLHSFVCHAYVYKCVCFLAHMCHLHVSGLWQVRLPTKPSPYPPQPHIYKILKSFRSSSSRSKCLFWDSLCFLQTEFLVADCGLPSKYEGSPARHSSILFSICLKPLESLRGTCLLCSASNNTDLGLQFAVAQ